MDTAVAGLIDGIVTWRRRADVLVPPAARVLFSCLSSHATCCACVQYSTVPPLEWKIVHSSTSVQVDHLRLAVNVDLHRPLFVVCRARTSASVRSHRLLFCAGQKTNTCTNTFTNCRRAAVADPPPHPALYSLATRPYRTPETRIKPASRAGAATGTPREAGAVVRGSHG